jgi:hypothetical protein
MSPGPAICLVHRFFGDLSIASRALISATSALRRASW